MLGNLNTHFGVVDYKYILLFSCSRGCTSSWRWGGSRWKELCSPLKRMECWLWIRLWSNRPGKESLIRWEKQDGHSICSYIFRQIQTKDVMLCVLSLITVIFVLSNELDNRNLHSLCLSSPESLVSALRLASAAGQVPASSSGYCGDMAAWGWRRLTTRDCHTTGTRHDSQRRPRGSGTAQG